MHWLLWAAAIFPAALAFRIQKRHWIDVPIWDEWDTPGLAILHFVQRNLTWADLFSQHNESRKVIPRLIHIAIAAVAGWDVRQGMALTFLAACAASVCALLYLKKREPLVPAMLFAWVVVNFLLFAPCEYENFLSGFVFEIFIPFLCLFACCAINLSDWPLSRKTLCTAGLAIFSTYTFAHGILLWPFAIPLPNFAKQSRPRVGWFVLNYFFYFAVGGLAIGLYFVGYHRPEVAPPPATFSQLPQVAQFVIVWLGAPLRSPWVSAYVSGALVAAAIATALSLALSIIARKRTSWRTYYPWLLLLGFSLTSGTLTAVGRVNLGIDAVFNTWFDGFSSMRYNAASIFAYVGVVGLVFNAWRDWLRHHIHLRTAVLIALSSLCTLLAVAWIHSYAEERSRVGLFQENRRRARAAVTWIKVLPENPEIFIAYPYPAGFWRRAVEMQRLGIIKIPMIDEEMFEQVSVLPRALSSEGGSLDIAQPELNGRVRFIGWARNPENNRRADYVVLGWEDGAGAFHPFTVLLTGSRRLDVVQVYNAGSLKDCGFNSEIDVSKLPPEADSIRAWAVDFVVKKAFPLGGMVRLNRSRAQ